MNKEDIIIGTAVIYWTIIKDGRKLGKFETTIQSTPWMSGNNLVCIVKGKIAPVLISNLEKKN